jgi:hypothetical protein
MQYQLAAAKRSLKTYVSQIRGFLRLIPYSSQYPKTSSRWDISNGSGLIRLTQFWCAPISNQTQDGKYCACQQERPHLAQRRPQHSTH